MCLTSLNAFSKIINKLNAKVKGVVQFARLCCGNIGVSSAEPLENFAMLEPQKTSQSFYKKLIHP